MPQVSINVNGRTYRLSCRDGEEARLRELADHLNRKVERLVADFGQMAPERLLLMAALIIADELWEAREQLAGLAYENETGAAAEPVANTEPADGGASPKREPMT